MMLDDGIPAAESDAEQIARAKFPTSRRKRAKWLDVAAPDQADCERFGSLPKALVDARMRAGSRWLLLPDSNPTPVVAMTLSPSVPRPAPHRRHQLNGAVAAYCGCGRSGPCWAAASDADASRRWQWGAKAWCGSIRSTVQSEVTPG